MSGGSPDGSRSGLSPKDPPEVPILTRGRGFSYFAAVALPRVCPLPGPGMTIQTNTSSSRQESALDGVSSGKAVDPEAHDAKCGVYRSRRTKALPDAICLVAAGRPGSSRGRGAGNAARGPSRDASIRGPLVLSHVAHRDPAAQDP